MFRRFYVAFIPFLIFLLILIVYIIDKSEIISKDALRSIFILVSTIPFIHIWSLNSNSEYFYRDIKRFAYYPIGPKKLLKKELKDGITDSILIFTEIICFLVILTLTILSEYSLIIKIFILSFYFITHLILYISVYIFKYVSYKLFKNIIIVSLFLIVLQLDITYIGFNVIYLEIIYAMMPNISFFQIFSPFLIAKITAVITLLSVGYILNRFWKYKIYYFE